MVAWIAGQLRIGAGNDLTYHHGLELVFHDPVLVKCPTVFHDSVFREPTQAEKSLVVRRIGEAPPVIVAFEADAGGQEPATALIAAEQPEVVHGIVFRYWRKDSEPGQRLAPWVRTPKTQQH